MDKLNQYWARVSAGVCIECGVHAPKHPTGKRCDDCLKRVAEYNRNRRNKPQNMHRATYRQKQKALPDLLGIIAGVKLND